MPRQADSTVAFTGHIAHSVNAKDYLLTALYMNNSLITVQRSRTHAAEVQRAANTDKLDTATNGKKMHGYVWRTAGWLSSNAATGKQLPVAASKPLPIHNLTRKSFPTCDSQ